MSFDSRIGTELAGYRIEALVGRGGMSVVYRAEHLRLGRKVALKLLAPELAENDAFRDRFVRESHMAAALDHPNVLPLYDAGEVQGLLFIAMRYVEGMDLGALLRMGPIEPLRAAAIVSQVGKALDAAHERGLVHRDVKPANILISWTGGAEAFEQVYLSDFGLTKSTSSDSHLTQTGQFIGTTDYAAPEQIEGKPLDGRADQYSLGCVLYECLTGVPPYPRESEMAVLWAHVHERAPEVTSLSPALPPAVDAVISKALSKTPRDRYPSCAELAGYLDEALRRPPASRIPITWGAPRWPWLVAGALAVLLLVLLAAALLRRGEEPVAGAGAQGGVAKIDPATSEVVETIPGAEDSQAAIGEGAVWVGSSRTVLKIDPTSNKSIHTGLRFPHLAGIAAGAGSVWITEDTPGAQHMDLHKIDQGTSLEEKRTSAGPTGIVEVGAGAVWICDNFSIWKVDPKSGRRVASLPVTCAPRQDAIAVDGQGLWAVGVDEQSLTRVNPRTGKVAAMIQLKSVTSVALGAGAVWASSERGTLVEINPATNTRVATFDIGASADAIAVGFGSVWIGDKAAGEVLRVDPVRGRVIDRIPIKGHPRQIAAGEGAVWVGYCCA